jgi:hypothetical protein
MIADTSNSLIKSFVFIVDPRDLACIDSRFSRELEIVFGYLREGSNVNIQMRLPGYLPDVNIRGNYSVMRILELMTEGPPTVFTLHKDVEKRIHEQSGVLPEMTRELLLLALSENLMADGIVTNSSLLVDARYTIDQYHRIKIVPFDEFRDTIQVIAVGNSVFWAAAYGRETGFDVFYQLTHWKAKRLFIWQQKTMGAIEKKELRENLRTALANRFPYILYSRDMVRFYQLQRDAYARRGRLRAYGLAIGFYINNFYLMLWGMLEQLTVIAKHVRNLPIKEKQCGIQSKDFWKAFGEIEKGLQSFVKEPKMSEWISLMADMRHKAAHNTIPIPTLFLTHTDESRRDDEEIAEILRKEEPELYRFMDSQTIEAMQPTLITMWREQKMEIIADGMVTGTTPDGRTYIRGQVISIDYDLSNLIAIMDAFLVKLFS